VAELGERFVAALSTRDTDALVGLLAPDVDFRGMTPGRFWEASAADAVLAILYQWFEPTDVVEEVVDVVNSTVVDRQCVDYRFRVRNPDGLHEVEQRAYYDGDGDGRIALMRVICSGFRPLQG
jgi:ketosteroid isomerase-like protein